MALTPDEMEEVKSQLALRMGPNTAKNKEMVPGAAPALLDTGLESLGQMEGGGGMGFGGINAAKQQADQLPAYNPNEGFNFDPKAGTEGGGALGGLASGLMGSMSIAKALRGKGKEPFGGLKDLISSEQVPETTPLPD